MGRNAAFKEYGKLGKFGLLGFQVFQDISYSITTLENVIKLLDDLKLCQLDQNMAHILKVS